MLPKRVGLPRISRRIPADRRAWRRARLHRVSAGRWGPWSPRRRERYVVAPYALNCLDTPTDLSRQRRGAPLAGIIQNQNIDHRSDLGKIALFSACAASAQRISAALGSFYNGGSFDGSERRCLVSVTLMLRLFAVFVGIALASPDAAALRAGNERRSSGPSLRPGWRAPRSLAPPSCMRRRPRLHGRRSISRPRNTHVRVWLRWKPSIMPAPRSPVRCHADAQHNTPAPADPPH